MSLRTTTMALLLVASMIGLAAAPAAATVGTDAETYSGANVEFTTQSNSVTGYAVLETVLVENVTVNSASEARSQAGADVDAGLDTAADLRGADVELTSRSRASATVHVASGAEMVSHDNHRGILQVRATDDDQIVEIDVGDGSQVDSESDRRAVVTNDDGTQGTFVVVGTGEVVVTDDGTVVAEVEQGSELVYRQYEGERSEDDEETERMIEEGVATAELYVQESQDDGEETVADVVQYGQEVTVEVTSESASTVELTAERATDEGTVLLASIDERAFENAEDVEVFVDGEAAARADSYSEVQQSVTDGDQPRYTLSQTHSASANTDLAVGVDGFSERTLRLTSDGSADGSTEDDADGFVDADGDGLGVGVAIASLLAALVAARRRA